MKKIVFIMIAVLICIMSGCREDGRIDHIDDSMPAPTPITVEKVTSIPGGAVIKYKIPKDKNLLGVKVVYTRNGEICESKASKYTDTLVVEGFGNTETQEAKMYSVGINEKLSESVPVIISPLPPPIHSVQFDIEQSFGGVVVSLQGNYLNADLSLVLMAADTLKYFPDGKKAWQNLQTFYTQSEAQKFSRRNLEAKPTDFALYVRDRWGNMSDTIYRLLTPIEEIKLPKTEFSNAMLPGDFYFPTIVSSYYRLEQLWSGAEVANEESYISEYDAPMPQWFTINLGHKMSISRFQKWPRSNFEVYSGAAPREFQLWGSDNPNPDGSWDESWHLLGEFEQLKPSGYGEGREVGPITDEDRDYWYNRTEFELIPTEKAPNPYMTVTHLRVKILSTYNTYGTDAVRGQVIICELTFWGQLKD
ncbi:MAG: DUF4959 domain-containing protein [Tannerella sp.]|jgi:hypothetical protein|nr:DUF4959 domain-containing protein [Tannerella sp.]